MFALDLTKIRTARSEFARVYAPEDLTSGQDAFAIAGPVSLTFEVEKDKDRFRLEGRVRSTLVLPCSRCLEGFEVDVDAPFDLHYQPKDAASGDGEQELGDDDLSASVYENNQIELDQLMREQFYLALPMKPLCREECRGLCSICGANLNRGACTCAPTWEDPRFAVLRALKESKKSKES